MKLNDSVFDPADTPAHAGLVTLSVVSHGQRALVSALFADLARLNPPGVAKLILTINRPEALPDGIDALPFQVEIVRNDRARGFGANHNRAFERCATPWFAVLNPDLQLVGDFLAPAMRSPGASDGLLAPRILEEGGEEADAVRRLMTPWQFAKRLLGWRKPEDLARADWYAGMCLLVRSQAFAAVGGFDERYYLYLEDADLCLRLQLAGWRIRQIEQAEVVHPAQRDSHRSFRHLRWHVASLLKHWLSGAYWRYLFARRRLGLGR